MKLSVFATINDLEARLKQLEPLEESFRNKLDDKLRLEFNYNSNHLEGNTLTYEETKQLIFKDLTSEIGHSFREYDEMKAHDAALLLIKQWAKERNHRPLSEQSIKNLNELILIKPFWKDAITPDGQSTRRQILVGDYKKFPNSVRLDNGELFEYAAPSDTPILMGELIDWYRQEIERKELPAVALAALLHYKFVRIHPFDDGNGRIARLLMNYALFCFDLPPVVIKSDDKKNYLQALQRADTGNVEAFVEYVARQLVWSLELSIKAAKGESVEEAEDLDKRIELLARRVKAEKRLEAEVSPKILVELVYPQLVDFFSILNQSLGKAQKMFLKVEVVEDTGDKISKNAYPSIEKFIDSLNTTATSLDPKGSYLREFSLNFIGLLDDVKDVSFSFLFKLKANQFTYTIDFATGGKLELGYRQGNRHELSEFAARVKTHIQKSILDKLE